jgi:hypothetical protein
VHIAVALPLRKPDHAGGAHASPKHMQTSRIPDVRERITVSAAAGGGSRGRNAPRPNWPGEAR